MLYHVSIDTNGRISIPQKIRKQAGLNKGDTLVLTLDENEIHLKTLDNKIKEARSLVNDYCKGADLLSDLKSLRDDDLKKDNHNEN